MTAHDERSDEKDKQKALPDSLLGQTELQQRFYQLQVIYHMTDAVSRAGDIESIYEEAMKSLQLTLGADRTAVVLLDAASVMRFVAWHGLPDAYRQAVEGGSPWSPTERDPRPVLAPDVATDTRLAPLRDVILAEGIHALGYIPLVYQGRLLGQYMIYYNQPHYFTADEIQLTQTIANHVVFAIERKRSEAALQAAHDELEERVQQRTAALSQSNSALQQQIARRQQAEEVLRHSIERSQRSERLLGEAQRLAHLGSWEWDVVSGKLTWSEELYRIYGLNPAEFIPTFEKAISFLHPEDRPRSERKIETAALSNQPIESYNRIIRPDGATRIIHSRTIPLLNENGELVKMFGAIQDITERKQAEAKLASTVHQLAALNEMGQVVAASLDLDVVFTRVLETLRPLLHAEAVFVLLGDEDEFVFAATDEIGEGSLKGKRVPVTAGIAGEVMRSGQSIHVYGEEAGRRVYQSIAKITGYHPAAVMAVPLRLRGDLIGVMEAVHSQADAFNTDDLQMLEAAATWTALAIGNARQHEAVQQHYNSQQRARQTAETLRTANIALTRTLSLAAVLETLLDYLRQLIDYSSAEVMLLESGIPFREEALRGQKKSDSMIQPVHYSSGRIAVINRALSLRIHTARGYPSIRHAGQISQQVLNPQWLPAIQSVLVQQESLMIADTNDYPEWRPHFQEAAAVRSWLGVPLVIGGKLIGLISINGTQPNYFTEEHKTLAEALATQAAGAAQNAQLFEQVRTGREHLRKLTKQVVSVQEEERQRISRELHDEAGQSLTALKLGLDQIKATLPLELGRSRQSIAEAIELTDMTMENIRLLAHDLRPLALDTLGLNATLEGLCSDFAHRTRLAIKYKGIDLPSLPSPVAISLYRYVQEALTNIAKHARATTVQVVLRRNPGMITLSVTDNGKGFQMEATATQPEGIGLIGMYERLNLLGGRLEIDSEQGQGTRLVAYIPFQEEQMDE